MSVMCSRPSTPPRSMNAPKSVMFLTIPLRTCPTWSSFIKTSRLVFRSASSSTRRLTTMLRRRLLSLMILNSKLCPSSSSMLGTRRSAIWLPGRNASTPIRSTTTPPLIFLTRVPETASSFSWASRIRSHTRMKSAFFFERTTAPSWSSRCSRKTSISSPSFKDLGSLNSSIGTAPSDLNPTSRMTAASVTRSTLDLTISPSSMLESVPSYSSVILAISSDEYSSWRSDRTRRGRWGAAGVSGLDSGRLSVSTSMQYTGSVVCLDACPGLEPPGLEEPRNLPREPFPRQRHDAIGLLVERQIGSIEPHRVRRGPQRGHRAGRVGMVARRQGLGLPSELSRVDAGAALGQPTAGPLFGARREKHLHGRVRKHHRPDVPAVHHHPPGHPGHRLPLLHVHPVPDLADRGDRGDMARHPLRPDRLLDVHARDGWPEGVANQHQADREIFGQRHDLLYRPRIPHPASRIPEVIKHGEGDRPIQRPRVEMRPPEPARHRRGRGALA